MTAISVIYNKTGGPHPKMLNEVQQEGETSIWVLEDQDQSSYVVRIKYINLYSIKLVLFTKLRVQHKSKAHQNSLQNRLWGREQLGVCSVS